MLLLVLFISSNAFTTLTQYKNHDMVMPVWPSFWKVKKLFLFVLKGV